MNTNQYGMSFGTQDLGTDPQYTTTQKRLQLDLNSQNPLFAVLPMRAGTNFSLLTGFTQTEQLFELHHGLGYIPQVFVSYTLLDIGTTNVVRYAIDQIILQEGGYGDDTIGYKIDEENFVVNHVLNLQPGSIIIPPITITSIAGNYDLRLKYIICNNEQIHSLNFQ